MYVKLNEKKNRIIGDFKMNTIGSIEVIKIMISLAGGLALFLFGMSILGTGLEKLSSGKMEKILEKLTGNVFKSVLLGALVTGVVQSSSATTVVVIGLVNSGILSLSSAIGVIMGANIGTTVTAQILRLGGVETSTKVQGVMSLVNSQSLAAIFAIVGILIYFISKKDNLKIVGEVFLGFGLLFNGMNAMEAAVHPLSELQIFRQIFETLSNPILGVLVGTLVTMLIQSSSASVGILQSISATGVLKCSAAFPIIMGQNIGTCITAILASIGANKNAKRAAMVHLYFNIIGTIIFLIGVYTIQYTIGFSFWNSSIDKGGIANFHTLFNVTVTLILLPFTKLLEKLACITIRDSKDDKKSQIIKNEQVALLDERFLVSPSVAIQQAYKSVIQMGKYAQYNFRETRTLFDKYDQQTVDRIREYESAIDKMEDNLNIYLTKIADRELTESESRDVTLILHLLSEYERIGDYSINIMESAIQLHDKQLKFSENAMYEYNTITDAVDEIIELSLVSVSYNDLDKVKCIEPLEETIDNLVDALKFRHIKRFKNGQCNVDTGVTFIDILTNLERISDHCSNIAVYIVAKAFKKENLYRHEYIENLHSGKNNEFKLKLSDYMEKYKLKH